MDTTYLHYLKKDIEDFINELHHIIKFAKEGIVEMFVEDAFAIELFCINYVGGTQEVNNLFNILQSKIFEYKQLTA